MARDVGLGEVSDMGKGAHGGLRGKDWRYDWENSARAPKIADAIGHESILQPRLQYRNICLQDEWQLVNCRIIIDCYFLERRPLANGHLDETFSINRWFFCDILRIKRLTPIRREFR